MGNRNTRRQSRRRKQKHQKPRELFVVAERRATDGEKKMLADYIKAAPTTDDIKKAKIFISRTGTLNFLAKHPELRKKFSLLRTATAAAK
jgi:hypothetical protein